MKKTLLLLLFIISCQLQAQLHTFSKKPIIHQENFQKQRVHWGYFLGFNSYDFKFDYKQNYTEEIEVKSTTSFNVGLIGNLRLQEYLDLRLEPGLFYSQRNLKFPGFDNDRDAFRNVKSTYIHIPLLLKFSSKRIGNFRPYMVGGASASYNLSSNYKSLSDNSERRFRMNRIAYNYELGFGVDIYLEYFIFSPSIRGVFGIGNEIIWDNDPNSLWTSNIDAMKTRAVVLNFAFH
ncbi:MAG: porin family protein [Bacteroidota bacterium]|nr:porin family protein [Bacteroidota bacterium]